MAFASCEEKKSHEQHSSEQHKTLNLKPETLNPKPETLNFKPETLLKPTNMYVITQVAAIKPEEKEMPLKTFLFGYITYDARQINTVSARVFGRIEKLYVKYRYQPIAEGQKLMDIYSKELETEQQNLLFLLKNDSENQTLIKASEQKLILLGLTSGQIDQIKSSGNILYSVTVYSPYTGHLHDIIQSINTTDSPSESGMNKENMVASTSSMQELQIKEGMYVSKGQTIFNIYDTKKIWALLNIPPDMQSAVKLRQKVKLEIDGLKDKEIESSIDFIEPVIRNNQKYVTARVYLNNSSDEIKIGSIVKAKLDGEQKGLFIPSTAIVSLGLSTVAFVKENGTFRTRKVHTGITSGDWTEITSGLSKDDTIAQNGQLLMDSESFIKIKK